MLNTLFDTTPFRCWVSPFTSLVPSLSFLVRSFHGSLYTLGLTISLPLPHIIEADNSMALIHELRNGHFASSASSEAGNNNNNNGGGGSSGNNPTDIFLLSMSRQNFQAVINAVFKMEQYWAGVTGVSQLLEKRTFSSDQISNGRDSS